MGGWAAAYCGRLFVQAGADVVRVDTDQMPAAWASDQAMDVFVHDGKRRVAVADVALHALAEAADVVVCEGANAQAVTALGVRQWSAPVKVIVTPFGLTGPKCDWVATPNVLLAMGGYTHLLGDAGGPPLNLPGHYVEFQSGTLAYALAQACRYTGQPHVADISMLETVMSLSQFTTVLWHCRGEVRGRHGNDFWYVAPSEMFACKDGWVYVNIVPQFWDPFTIFLDRPELLLDDRFATNDSRMVHREALHAEIAAALADIPAVVVEARARQCRVPVGVVRNLDEILEDPQLIARNYWRHMAGLAVPGSLYKRVPDNVTQRGRNHG